MTGKFEVSCRMQKQGGGEKVFPLKICKSLWNLETSRGDLAYTLPNVSSGHTLPSGGVAGLWSAFHINYILDQTKGGILLTLIAEL